MSDSLSDPERREEILRKLGLAKPNAVRVTFTAFMTPHHLILERLPSKYHMELNQRDMLAVLSALASSKDERAQSLRSTVLETLNIEEV